jgi:hypothetical protein
MIADTVRVLAPVVSLLQGTEAGRPGHITTQVAQFKAINSAIGHLRVCSEGGFMAERF